MHRFEVWAPGRRSVDAIVDGRRVALAPRDGGWWEGVDANAGPGSRYGLSLDGGDVRPDPRSPSQPDGVLGLSEVIDHGAHRWNDAGWRGAELPGLVIYELHVGTFSPAGTFDGAVERIDHLAGLGIDAVEVMPVAEFSGDRGWGYDGVDLYAPHHAYGGPAGFKRMVDACHAAGLAVFLDVVYNHLGPVGNFLSEFGPYFTDRHRTLWGEAVNLDGPGSAEVRRFVIDNATAWVRDYHVDGLRLDAVHSMFDESPVHLLEELTADVKAAASAAGRTAVVIAESELNDPRIVRDRKAGGFGLDAAWADDWHHSLHALLTGEVAGYYEGFGSLERLALALRQAWVRGPSPAGLPPDRFVVAAQNHDQVGNRAGGERLGALVSLGRLKIAAALLLTAPFTPILFEGEEWAATTPFLYFTDHADKDLARAVSEGRRQEFAAFGWKPEQVPDPQDPGTFERSKLRWDELARAPHREMLDWYRRLLALRRSLPTPVGDAGHVDVIAGAGDCTLLFRRPGLAARVNLGEVPWRGEIGGDESLALASDGAVSVSGGHVTLPPDSVAVFLTSGADRA